jgi:hypothetical protein
MSVPIAQLARRFLVARAQVRNVLRSAVAAGLLKPAPPDGTAYLMTPELEAGIRGYIAAMCVLAADTVIEAQREMETAREDESAVATTASA